MTVPTSWGTPVVAGQCAMRHTDPAGPAVPCAGPAAYVVTLPTGVRFELCADCTAAARAHQVPLVKIEQR